MLSKIEIGRVLRIEREAINMTLRELSSRCFISIGYISEVERGAKEASSEVLRDLCAGLGISQAYLFQEVAVRFIMEEVDELTGEPISVSVVS